MPRIPLARTRIATLGTLFGLGVLAAVAISASSGGQPKPATAATAKRANVRTIVVHRTVGVLPTVPGAAAVAAAPAAGPRAAGAVAAAGAAPAAWSSAPPKHRRARVYATAPRSTGRPRVNSGGSPKRESAGDDGAAPAPGPSGQTEQEEAPQQAPQPAQSTPTTTATPPPTPTHTVTHTHTQEPQEPQQPQEPQEPQEPQR